MTDQECHPTTESQPDPDDILREARALQAQGRLAEARALVEGELRRDSSRFEPLDLEAELLVAQREAALAMRLLDEYQRYYPEDGRVAARMAWIHWQEGRGDDALAEVRAALARDPTCHAARRHAIQWTAEAGDYPAVATLAEQGLAQLPEDRTYLLAAARAAAHARQEPAARLHFENARRLFPDDEPIVVAYAQFLLDMNHSAEAARMLADCQRNADASPAMMLVAIEAHFRAQKFPPAFELAERLGTDPAADQPEPQRALLALLTREAGTQQGDQLAFRLLTEHRAVDCLGVEFLEVQGARQNRSNLNRIFDIVSTIPQRYPRTIARFLSTFHEAPLTPGKVARWVAANQQAIEANTILWGGVGAWMVGRRKWREAVAHLTPGIHRPDVRPWMLMLLAGAHEALGEGPEANAAYRLALQRPPDHSEFSIRARLAYNLAMDSMPGAGMLVLLDASPGAARYASVEDAIRQTIVEALHELASSNNADERTEIVDQGEARIKELARHDASVPAKAFLRQFRQKATEL